MEEINKNLRTCQGTPENLAQDTMRGGGCPAPSSQHKMLYRDIFFCMGPHQVGLYFRQVGLYFRQVLVRSLMSIHDKC